MNTLLTFGEVLSPLSRQKDRVYSALQLVTPTETCRCWPGLTHYHFALMHLFWIFFWSSISRNSLMFVFFSNSCFTVKTFCTVLCILHYSFPHREKKENAWNINKGLLQTKNEIEIELTVILELWDEVVAVVAFQQFQIDLPCLMWNLCFRSWLLFIRIDSQHLNFIMGYKIYCIINGGHKPTRENLKQK